MNDTAPNAASQTLDRNRQTRMIPRLKWVLTVYGIFMAVIVGLALAGVLRPIEPLVGTSPIVYLLARRFIEGSWDWMYEFDAEATAAAIRAEAERGALR